MPESADNSLAKPNGELQAGEAKRSDPDEGRRGPSVSKAVEGFLCEVDALADALPLIMPLITDSTKEAVNDFEGFLDTRCEKVGEHRFGVPTDEYTEYLNLKRRLDRNRRATQIIPRSFFTSLVSHYDAFLGNLLRAVFYMRPEVLNDSEHRITFKELTSFSSLDAAREAVVEKRLSPCLGRAMRSSLNEWKANSDFH